MNHIWITMERPQKLDQRFSVFRVVEPKIPTLCWQSLAKLFSQAGRETHCPKKLSQRK